MAIKIKTVIHKIAPKAQNKNPNKIETIIHKMIPAIPSPIPAASAFVGVKSFKDSIFFRSNRLGIFPERPLSLTPRYRPMKINRKNAEDNIDVDNIDFSIMVLCSPKPRNQIDNIVKKMTIKVTAKIYFVFKIVLLFMVLRNIGGL